MNVKPVTLDLPHLSLFPSYIEALKEGFYSGSESRKSAEDIAELERDPQRYIQSLNIRKTGSFKTPDGTEVSFVPSKTLWLSTDHIFIGSVSFRHELSEVLEHYGGHVGYGIRPSFQGKGYASEALRLTRKRALNMGLERLLITCSPENLASEKVILKNNGQFIDISYKTFGYKDCVKRYWVPSEAPPRLRR
jgi:predicted acetyltransferase